MSSRYLTAALATVVIVSASYAQEAPLADPMRPALRRPAGAGSRSAEAPRLEGIVISASRRLALIGGEFLQEGEQIYGTRIQRIERDSVTVVRNGKTLVLRPESVVAPRVAESGEQQ